jgi:hypothetical protein
LFTSDCVYSTGLIIHGSLWPTVLFLQHNGLDFTFSLQSEGVVAERREWSRRKKLVQIFEVITTSDIQLRTLIKTEGSCIDLSDTTHIHWVEWGTGTPKDRDEVNRQEVSECDG